LVALVILRLYELFRFKSQLGIDLWEALSPSLGYDSKLIGCFTLLVGIVCFPISFWSRYLAIRIYNLLSILLVIAHLILIQYFFTNLSLLDRSLLLYDVNEIMYICKTELVHISWPIILLSVLLVVSLAYIFFSSFIGIISVKKYKYLFIIPLYAFIIISFIDYKDLKVPKGRFESLNKYFYVNNKVLFLANSIVDAKSSSVFTESGKHQLDSLITRFHKKNSDYHYISNTFPFLHDDPYSNTLGPYFKKSKTPPSIVIILVESLSRSFSGPNAFYGSFTPFLDSLAFHSLYWENAVSNAPRTFGVLVNTLGSLPEGEPHVSTLDSFPKCNTLLKELKKNGYYSNFFYGSWIGFTKYDNQLKHLGIDKIYSQPDFDSTKYTLPKKNVFVWGYYDNDLFDQSFDFIQRSPQDQKLINIYLTVGMHSPNNVYPEKYNQEYLKRQIAEKRIPAEIPVPLQGDIVLSILHDDDALQEFFSKYKKRGDYNNTIFLIVGDHNINSLPLKNPLDIYHVPLMIYSPLLKKGDRFKSVVNHRDITPALLGLLSSNYGIECSAIKHWLGKGLDTNHTFTSNRFIPLYMRNENFPQFVVGNYVINNEELFLLSDGLELKRSNDPQLFTKLKEEAMLYKKLDEIAVKNNLLTW